MDTGAAHFAAISRLMAATNDFLLFADPVYAGLDKSPMLFWAAALSIKIFGATTFAFKLPLFLLSALTVYATYQLARLLYGLNTARLSALVLATTQGMFLGACHAGAELMLACWIITAIWCFKAFALKQRWHFLVGGAAAVACGILTKGLIALFIPMGAFIMDWLLRRRWNKVFSPKHLLTFLIICLLLIPAAIGISQRSGLDLHAWLTTNVDNAAFEYLSGTSPAAPETTPPISSSWPASFFLMPGAFVSLLPWTLLLVVAVFLNIKKLIKRNFLLRRGREFITVGGLIATFFLLNFPFHLPVPFVVAALPLAAIATARLLRHLLLTEKFPSLAKTFTGIQTILSAFLLLAAIAIPTLMFNSSTLIIICWIIAFLLWLVISIKNKKTDRLLWTSVSGALLANLFFVNFFYASLSQFDAGCLAGRYIRQHNIPSNQVSSYHMEAPLYALDFYADETVPATAALLPQEKDSYLLLMDADLAKLDAANQPYEVVLTGALYQGKWWQPEFFDHETRHFATRAWSLVHIL